MAQNSRSQDVQAAWTNTCDMIYDSCDKMEKQFSEFLQMRNTACNEFIQVMSRMTQTLERLSDPNGLAPMEIDSDFTQHLVLPAAGAFRVHSPPETEQLTSEQSQY